MAAKGSRFWHYVLISAYAAGVVVVGANDLRTKHFAQAGETSEERENARELVKHLRGGDVRAQIDPEVVKESGRDAKDPGSGRPDDPEMSRMEDDANGPSKIGEFFRGLFSGEKKE